MAGLDQIINSLRATFYIFLMLLYGTIANILFIFIGFCISPFYPAWGYEIISQVANGLWFSLQHLFEHLHGAQVTISGDTLPTKESAFVISNHLSYTDFFMIQAVAVRQQTLPYCRYFAKYELIWTLPVYGLALYLSGMVMVKRNWTEDSKLAQQSFEHIKKLKSTIWLVSYLEGTRFTPEKKAQAQAFAKKRDLPELEHVLLPRTKGFVAAINELRDSHVKHVYDFTLVYAGPKGFQQAPSLMDVLGSPWLSPKYAFHVHVMRHAIADLPRDSVELVEWAQQQFRNKDALLERKRQLWQDRQNLVEP